MYSDALPDRIFVRVTNKEIKKGKKKSSDSCPIALAIKKLYPTYKFSIGLDSCDFNSEFTRGSYKPSRAAQRFMNRFDEKGRKSVKPFNFVLTRFYPYNTVAWFC